MSRSAVARNYAATLFDLASEADARDRYGEVLEQVASVYDSTPNVRAFLDTPRVTLEEKLAVVRETLAAGAPEFFVRFLLVVLERRRQRSLPGIARAYRDLLDQHADRVHATVTVPFEADQEVRTQITGALERQLGGHVVADFEVDPDLLGGFVARAGDRLVDASLRRRLDRMKWSLG